MEEEQSRKFAPGCQNPHYAKIRTGANFGIGANFGPSANFGIGASFGTGANFGIRANFGTLPTSCVRNPLSHPLLTF